MKFPDHNIVGRSNSSQIMKLDDWARAKTKSDFEAASRIIGQLWSDKKTYQLKQVFSDPEKVIFISQPTTTGTNILAKQFAEKLSKDFKTDFILGDDFSISTHTEQSKRISYPTRAFHPREYELVDIETLKQAIGNREVCLVEDVITSGGSVASFTKALKQVGIEVKSVTALTGEKRLNIDEKTYDRLEKALKTRNIIVDTPALVNSLTRSEAGGLIVLAYAAKTETAVEKLKSGIEQRIQYEKEQSRGYPLPQDISESNQDPELPAGHQKAKFGTKENAERLKQDAAHMNLERSTQTDFGPELPQFDSSYVKRWNKDLDESNTLFNQENSKEMKPDRKLEKEEPQLEIGR